MANSWIKSYRKNISSFSARFQTQFLFLFVRRWWWEEKERVRWLNSRRADVIKTVFYSHILLLVLEEKLGRKACPVWACCRSRRYDVDSGMYTFCRRSWKSTSPNNIKFVFCSFAFGPSSITVLQCRLTGITDWAGNAVPLRWIHTI